MGVKESGEGNRAAQVSANSDKHCSRLFVFLRAKQEGARLTERQDPQ